MVLPTQHRWHPSWRSGERERDNAKAAKQWPGGEPVGRGHDSPYLKERWARAIAPGVKKVEGRPDEGVRCRPTHHQIPAIPTIPSADIIDPPVNSGLRTSRRATTSHSRSALHSLLKDSFASACLKWCAFQHLKLSFTTLDPPTLCRALPLIIFLMVFKSSLNTRIVQVCHTKTSRKGTVSWESSWPSSSSKLCQAALRTREARTL